MLWADKKLEKPLINTLERWVFIRSKKGKNKMKEWIPEDKKIYWYITKYGIADGYFDKENLTCISRMKAGLCFETREKAVRKRSEKEYELINWYEEQWKNR